MAAVGDLRDAPWNAFGWTEAWLSADGTEAGPFGEEDVAEVIAAADTGDGWDGYSWALLRLNDGRFAAWESSWGPTGSGFSLDAYGGDAEVWIGSTVDAVLARIGEEGRAALRAQIESR